MNTGNALSENFYHNMLEAKCDVLKELIRNEEACARYERLSRVSNKLSLSRDQKKEYKERWLSSIYANDKR